MNNDMDSFTYGSMEPSQIPTPDQVPAPINLDSLPEVALKSSALESLIQQNQDLSSRLRILLKRMNANEQVMTEQEQLIQIQLRKISNYEEKISIVEEKDASWESRHKELLKDLAETRSKLLKAEKQYYEL